MELGLIGSTKKVTNIIMGGFIESFNLNIYIFDRQNIKFLKNILNGKRKNKISLYENLKLFLKENQNLIIEIDDKETVTKIINIWTKIHREGLIILTGFYKYGFGDLLFKRLNKNGKRIEIVYLLYNLKGTNILNCNNGLVLGGDYLAPLTKHIRMKISSKDKQIFIVSRKESELIYLFNVLFFVLVKAYLLEIGQTLKGLNIDIETIKKGLKHILYLNENYLEGSMYGYVRLLNKSHLYNKSSIFKVAEENIFNDEYWLISVLRNIINKNHLKHITVFGVDNHKTIKEILKLSSEKLTKINIVPFSNKISRTLINSRIRLFNDPYLASKNSELIIILKANKLIEAISLIKLEKNVAKKIIIDKANIFEIEETKSLNWIYISKDRPRIKQGYFGNN